MTSISVDTSVSMTSSDVKKFFQKSSEWLGRQVVHIKDFFVELGNHFCEGAKKVMKVLRRLVMHGTSMARICRLGISAFAVIERCVGFPGVFTKVTQQFANAEGMIYTYAVGTEIKYFGTNKHKEGTVLYSLGMGSLLVAGVCGAAILAGKVLLMTFSQIGEALGKIPIFQSVMNSGFNFMQVASGLVALGSGFLAVDSAIKLARAKTHDEKVQHGIDLAWYISETALAVLCAIGYNHFYTMLALGIVAAGLGIASYIQEVHIEDKAEEEWQFQELKTI